MYSRAQRGNTLRLTVICSSIGHIKERRRGTEDRHVHQHLPPNPGGIRRVHRGPLLSSDQRRTNDADRGQLPVPRDSHEVPAALPRRNRGSVSQRRLHIGKSRNPFFFVALR